MSIFKDMVEFEENNRIDFNFKVSKIAREIRNSNRIFDNTSFDSHEINTNGMKILYGLRAVNEKHLNGGITTHVEATVYYVYDMENNLLMDRETNVKALDIVQSEMNKKYS